MNNEIKTLTISNYNKFQCIADKCKYTCCDGWDIGIDNDTYDKWKGDKAYDILENIKITECGNKKSFCVKKETKERCPFLDIKGLCDIVKSYGEEYLSSTCRIFPRIENDFFDRKELTLSCACPMVVDIIGDNDSEVNITSEVSSDLIELKIRDTIVSIIKEEGFLLEDKLIICYEMLLNEYEDIYDEFLKKYKNIQYINERIKDYSEINLNIYDGLEEINNLFLDVVENYRGVSILKTLLEDISIFAENANIEVLANQWDKFKKIFDNKAGKLLKSCILSKIYSSCVCEDIEEMIQAYEMIIIEYLLVRYAVFLRYSSNRNNDIVIQDVKDYIVAFSRIIGNNTEAMIEFFEDGFEDSILELGYLYFIALF
ncbi:FliB family protein [Clostridium bornimense]|uniref:FliB family protein n=1 Tax=Clostridium bornimense TaxID=1216932 RepID=W6SK18_9CLOT|nr:flagellin lysine-N-methylase [Clostridium bornimense]CDM70115.1 FliB family protein [Clostridium bornimense]